MKTYIIWNGVNARFPAFIAKVEANTPEEAWVIGTKDHWIKSRPDLCFLQIVTKNNS